MIKPSSRSDLTSWWTAFTRRQGPQFHMIQGGVELLFCLMGPLTPALLVARLRRPRPALRRMACQPGFVACAALCLATLLEVDLSFLQLATIPAPASIALPGAAVVASWTLLASLRLWRPEASWVDRAGRIVGAYWLAMTCWTFWVAS
jgi:hypothetical protein